MKMAILALLLSFFMLGASLQRKKTEEWGTYPPCVEAIEEIVEVVNERLDQ